jgi:hypothetical protein
LLPLLGSRAQTLAQFTLPIRSTSFATAPLRAAGCFRSFARQGVDVRFPLHEKGANRTAALVSGRAKAILGGGGEQVAALTCGQPILLLTKV